jgi:hypothetical protein
LEFGILHKTAMKKIIFSSIFLFCFLSQYGQTITLSFSAKDSLTQGLLVLDSVNIQNLDQNCDTTLYDPVSGLVLDSLWPAAIEDPAGIQSASFLVTQNVPNPFRGTTLVSVYLKNEGGLSLAVYDLQGKNLSQYRDNCEKGWHQFAISTSGYRMLFLSVSDGLNSETIKMFSSGSGIGEDRISQMGSSEPAQNVLKSFPEKGGFIFYLGEQLRYTAYVEGYYENILYDEPVSSESYIFPMVPADTAATLPEVTTAPVTNITTNSATTGGDVTSDGGIAVTQRGVCYSIYPGPDINDPRTSDGSGTGPFVSNLDGLTFNTTYYVRAYATNAVGTAYGNELSFTTLNATLPEVTTDSVTYITQTTANSGGNVIADGGDFVYARGVCWDTSPDPTVNDAHTLDGGGLGSFESYLSGLTPDTLYYVRAYASNNVGTSYGNELTFTTLEITLPAVTTAPVTDITSTTATSGGNVAYDGGAAVTARGVCWSLSANPTIAGDHTTDGIGTGQFVSYLTGLTPDTLYYIRAYATNSLGTAYGNELSFSTLPAPDCGYSMVINHIAGNVAPVTKTTTYETVDNIPGEPAKCWITNNLGSGRQALSVDDNTEASAGWYWQFNRMQGYKHDGTTVTPAWTITWIEENSDWISDNDPCTIELGSGWRIPTLTEWTNVDAAGNWTNWNGPWNSALKLHAAGCIDESTGYLGNRGSDGYYWSSVQFSYTWAYYLFFSDADCMTVDYDKGLGWSVRCVHE